MKPFVPAWNWESGSVIQGERLLVSGLFVIAAGVGIGYCAWSTLMERTQSAGSLPRSKSVQTESTHGATATHVPVVLVTEKVAKQRRSAGEIYNRMVEFNDGKRPISVKRLDTASRDQALVWAGALVSQLTEKFEKINSYHVGVEIQKAAIEANYRELFARMHAIKYRSSEAGKTAEFDDGFSYFEAHATAAMTQGDAVKYSRALQELSRYIASKTSSGGNFDANLYDEVGAPADGIEYDLYRSDHESREKNMMWLPNSSLSRKTMTTKMELRVNKALMWQAPSIRMA